MGHQPSLDGVRAASVIAVILYHAGFSWAHGGFFGVEVFFVVSGFLITSLLIEERDATGRVSLEQFWLRRWRRLLPALFTVLLVVGVWAVFFGTTEQHVQLRHDFPWGIFYLANWGQVFGKVAYFSGSPTLLRHLWSLAVEEQWYVLWPLVFIAMHRRRGDDATRGARLAIVAIGVMVATALASLAGWPTRFFNPFRMSMQPVDTTNFLYLSTITRSSGLLLGAAMAFRWRPWRIGGAARQQVRRTLDVAGAVAVAVIVLAVAVGHVPDSITYRLVLPLVTLASAVMVAVVVHPWATGMRSVFGSKPMVAIGQRSYGLYLWSWPISRMVNAFSGSWSRFLLAMVIAVPASELCFRFVETPIRKGALGRWWAARATDRTWRLVALCGAASAVALVLPLVGYFRSAPATFDAALDTGANVVFDPNAALGGATTSTAVNSALSSSTAPADTSSAVTTTSSTIPVPGTAAHLPRRIVIVGDSTAHSVARNKPAGLESTFVVADGSVEGCSVYSSGTAISSYPFKRSFTGCSGWEKKWAAAATRSRAEVAVVMLGAWDVFDARVDGKVLPFGSAANDARFTEGLQRGIDALTATGAKVALLEIPCMRPVHSKGAGVPPLPERGDDQRVARVNELLRRVAAQNAATTTFVTGPQQYCTDPVISTSLAYRWDGVHAYKPGANLTFEAMAAQLLRIPVG